jgi:ribosomal protein S18 acetylase RimI-like enzyme
MAKPIIKTNKNRKNKTKKIRKIRIMNTFKGGMNRAEYSESRDTPTLNLGAEETSLLSGTENQSGYESNASVRSNATVLETTPARVFDEQNRNKNVSHTLSDSVINMDIKDLKLPIYTVPGNGPIRKINFYKDGVNVGYAAFRYNSRVFELNTLYINENYRGSGYGKRILKLLIQYAFEQLQADEIQLNNQTNSLVYNPSKHRNKMYTKSKFVQMKSKNYNKWMSLKRYRYKKFKSTIFRYLRS